jgi:hypothetical protein
MALSMNSAGITPKVKRPSGQAQVSPCEQTQGAERMRTPYQKRLEALGLTNIPVAAGVTPVRQFQLAQLAATLGIGEGGVKPIDLVERAMQIWNISGWFPCIMEQADQMARGVCVYHRVDWGVLGRALIQLLDGGMIDVEDDMNRGTELNIEHVVVARKRAAGVRAGNIVAQLWRIAPHKYGVAKALFPGKSETAKRRAQKLVELLEYAKRKIADCCESEQKLGAARKAKGDAVQASILKAWEPLALSKGEKCDFDNAVEMARWLLKDSRNAKPEFLDFAPQLARWAAVMRQEQAAAAKNRA